LGYFIGHTYIDKAIYWGVVSEGGYPTSGYVIKKPLDGMGLQAFSPQMGSEATANENTTKCSMDQWDVANKTRDLKTEHENVTSNNGCVADKPGAGRNPCMRFGL
jgi:hypothetical protein